MRFGVEGINESEVEQYDGNRIGKRCVHRLQKAGENVIAPMMQIDNPVHSADADAVCKCRDDVGECESENGIRPEDKQRRGPAPQSFGTACDSCRSEGSERSSPFLHAWSVLIIRNAGSRGTNRYREPSVGTPTPSPSSTENQPGLPYQSNFSPYTAPRTYRDWEQEGMLDGPRRNPRPVRRVLFRVPL
jgi:hypothetical protein